MKRDDIILGIILLVMVICSGMLAKNLHKKQQEIANSRHMLTKTPLAGFHKFAADVAWMKFLQMDSTHNVNKENAKAVYNEIIKIIELD